MNCRECENHCDCGECILSGAEFTRHISQDSIILDKLSHGIDLGSQLFGADSLYIIIQTEIWETEMRAFCDYSTEFAENDGYELVISVKVLNLPEIAAELTKRGWQKSGTVKIPYGAKAVTFSKSGVAA